MKLIRNTPLGISGLALGLASLGILLQPHGAALQYTFGALSAAAITLLILKFFLAFDLVREDLRNPHILGSMPTSTMALTLLCVYIKPFAELFAYYMWHLAVVIHLCWTLLYIKRFLLKLKLDYISPVFFIPFVATAAPSASGVVMGAELIAKASFYTGTVLYFTVLPFVIYRMVKKPLPEPVKPTIAIFAAPIGLCLAGYFAAFDRQSDFVVYFLFAFVAASYIFVSINMVFLLRLKFYPTYSAFTFPYVICATAFRDVNGIFLSEGIEFFTPVVFISKWVAFAIVVYVLIRYMIFFCGIYQKPGGKA